MDQKNSWHSRFTFVLLLALSVTPAASAQSRPFMGHREFRNVTRDLPAIDRVELLQLKMDGDQRWNGEIGASKVLQGAAAQKGAALWRRQNYNKHLAACHEPNYAIKFYAQGRL